MRTDTYDPELWQLTPKEPTMPMLRASWGKARIADAYEAMLSVAPTPPASAQSVGLEHGGCNAHRMPGLADGVSGKSAQSVEPVAVRYEVYSGSDDSWEEVGKAVYDAAMDDGCKVRALGVITDAKSVEPVALADAIIREMCELSDRTSPEDEPDAMVANPQEMHGCVERALETLGVITTQPSAKGARDSALEEVANAIRQYRSGETISAELMRDIAAICALVRNMKSKKES